MLATGPGRLALPWARRLDRPERRHRDADWGSWRFHILDVRMGHDRKPNYEAVPR